MLISDEKKNKATQEKIKDKKKNLKDGKRR